MSTKKSKFVAGRKYRLPNRRVCVGIFDDGSFTFNFKRLEGKTIHNTDIGLSAEAAFLVAHAIRNMHGCLPEKIRDRVDRKIDAALKKAARPCDKKRNEFGGGA